MSKSVLPIREEVVIASFTPPDCAEPFMQIVEGDCAQQPRKDEIRRKVWHDYDQNCGCVSCRVYEREQLGCLFCNNPEGESDGAHLRVVTNELYIDGGAEWCEQNTILICLECTARIAALWEKAGRPKFEKYEEVINAQ